MSESIFRQSALERLADPERLDAPQHLVAPSHWIALAAIVAACLLGIAWAAVTRVPIEVGAQGVIIGPNGLAEIASPDSGQVLRILVSNGASVKAGDAIAELDRADLRRDLAEAEARLATARQRFAGLSGFYSDTATRDRSADRLRLASLADSSLAMRRREKFLLEKVERMQGLLSRGFVTRDRVQDTEDELAALREKLASLAESEVRLRIEDNARTGEARLNLLEEQRAIDELDRTISRLTAQLAERRFVRAGQAGQVTEIKIGVGDTVSAGTAVATIAPNHDPTALVARFYVPAAEGKRIAVGMPAMVAPANVEHALYGYIEGTVTVVAPLPATPEGLRRVLRNDALVDQMFAGGAPIEVLVALRRDPRTPSGYRWSASQGPARALTPGTQIGGMIIVERRRVIGLLVSGLSD